MILHINFTRIVLIVMALLLSSCTGPTKYYPATGQPKYITWQQRQIQLSHLEAWQAKGAISIQQEGHNDIAHFNWQQDHEVFTVVFYAPMFLGSAKLTGDNKETTLWKSATEKITAKTPEQLMQQEFGWVLPVTNLKYWLLGLPLPNIDYQANFDSNHYLYNLQQQGWEIRYQEYTHVGGIDLPSKVLILNSKLYVKVVINNWQILGYS